MNTKHVLPVLLSIALAIILVACGTPATQAPAADTAVPAAADTAVPAAADTAVPAATDTTAPAAGDTAMPAATDTASTPAAGDVVAKFVFSNVGAVDICQLFLSHVSKNEWGPDQLQGQTIAAGGKFTLTNIPAGTYDAKWVGCDKTEGTLQIDIKN